jgi:xanthine dehydrogenase accessory factor
MNNISWFDGINFCQSNGKGYVLLTIMGSVGSTPRSAGTKMVVTDDRIFDTIGGGQLEFRAIKLARDMLANGDTQQHVEHFPLAAKLAQCCGGATHVLFEPMNTCVPQLAIFGAGHVAKALLPIISQLPIAIKWIDNRPEQFTELAVANSVDILCVDDPVETLGDLHATTHLLVMTHDHQLDFDLVVVGLAIEQMEYVGLIGSNTKAKRFKYRLQGCNTPAEQLAKLVCPVGLTQVAGKKPIEVAVSIAAQLIPLFNDTKNKVDSGKQQQKSWQQTKQIIELL